VLHRGIPLRHPAGAGAAKAWQGFGRQPLQDAPSIKARKKADELAMRHGLTASGRILGRVMQATGRGPCSTRTTGGSE